MAFIGYLSFRVAVALFAIIPFRIVYFISDVSFLLIYYLAKYRRVVVMQNLEKSFPNLNLASRKAIERKYYQYMTDLIFESIKGMSMNVNQINKRHAIDNIEILDKAYSHKQSIIGVTGHYGNWEWGAYSSGVQLKHQSVAFYKPLSNKFIERYMKRRRAKYNCTLASIYNTFETFTDNVDKPSVFIMVADQSPTNLAESHWITFLKQDTACLHGPEKYARLHNLPVYYIDIQRVKRGYYVLHASLLAENPNMLEPGKLTEMYMRTLEQRIVAQPQYWLWSHRRWKRKRHESNGR